MKKPRRFAVFLFCSTESKDNNSQSNKKKKWLMVLLKLNMAAASLALNSWHLDMHVCGLLVRTNLRITRGFIKLELIETI